MADQGVQEATKAMESVEVGADAAEVISKSEQKRRAKAEAKAEAKAAKAAKQEKIKLEADQKRIEEAKSVKLVLDDSLPAPIVIKVKDASSSVGKRVKICGWVQFRRSQGAMMFIELRDGTGWPPVLQTVLTGDLAKTYDALTLHREASIVVYGNIIADDRAKGGVELHADYWEVIGKSDEEIEMRFNQDSEVSVLLDNRYLHLRSQRLSTIMKMRSHTVQAFREFFFNNDFFEVTPPTLVQCEVEGGSTLFEVDYFGEPAYLTQSSQLYLETAIPALGNVFSILSSYRAEKSRTRRHLAEYAHVEGEMAFYSFDQLLSLIEDMVVSVSENVLAKSPGMIESMNPAFAVPQKPFLRMTYEDAIKWLQEHKVFKEDGSDFEFGDDIPEAPERHMTDTINRPILLHGFPVTQKPFYMSRPSGCERTTESVDLLMPGVGEIVGGSMREWNMERLRANYKANDLEEDDYFWYNDQRRFGTCPHGGFGLGLERFLCWMLDIHHIREATMYPRYIGRCTP